VMEQLCAGAEPPDKTVEFLDKLLSEL
jgi:hypothetical protein